MGAPGDKRHARSYLSFIIGDVDIATPIKVPEDASLRWAWFQGSSVTVTRIQTPVQVTATSPPGSGPAYSDIAYVALQREEPGVALNEPISINRVLRPDETWTFAKDWNQPAQRMDVWVYEHGPNGKAYHIFRIVDAPKVLASPQKN